MVGQNENHRAKDRELGQMGERQIRKGGLNGSQRRGEYLKPNENQTKEQRSANQTKQLASQREGPSENQKTCQSSSPSPNGRGRERPGALRGDHHQTRTWLGLCRLYQERACV
jgi:hypothetical protein